ncbi:U6 small nuclear RNA (adenine-(43)-N(6))-methyltransferase [Ceratitis capitata]|uniref:U6 small nuclear RNA (adenine-(43)-N(6))-methyltransferase n=1 Tax=Ceratitis capitata TaxID=7213 RepID=W8C378_CERCA|nr:U6 small nuclear RNA (adenine-(43)-N(6))-methyltransferase [Ceratitis capitata]
MKNKRLMHPRNIFRTPPDYTELAIKYKEFRKVCKLELNGRVCIDYRNESTLRALTQMLLEEYFQLRVEFAPGSLVPTLPLRLNYILWLEDLITSLKLADAADVRGIDIGCGSSCIYTLLGARKNSWRMYALESNDVNLEFARSNVKCNNLEHLVEIFKQTNKLIIFKDFFDSKPNVNFHFCLCNPPFYDSTLPNPFHGKTRNEDKRTPPHNCHTGHDEELACEGGEVQFVHRIIEESELYPERIGIYTSMLGHKSSVGRIIEILTKKQITNVSTTEFCQGNTTRWGIAWSFSKDFQLDAHSSLKV